MKNSRHVIVPKNVNGQRSCWTYATLLAASSGSAYWPPYGGNADWPPQFIWREFLYILSFNILLWTLISFTFLLFLLDL